MINIITNIDDITSLDDVVQANPLLDSAASETCPLPSEAKFDPSKLGSAPQGVITNAVVVAAIFGQVPEAATAVVCSKAGDPANSGWPPQAVADVDRQCQPGVNNYVNCATFRREQDGALNVRKANFASYHATVLDDVGSKVPFERLSGLEPSWILETSPDNYQVGIIHDGALTDQMMIDQFQGALKGRGLSDPAALNGSTRWVRLPIAVNGKAKHRTADGAPFRCKLVTWNPERRFSIEQVVKMLRIEAEFQAAARPIAPQGLREVNFEDTASLEMLLAEISPNCGYGDWTNVCMAVHNETGGSDAGLDLVDSWSSGGNTYQGRRAIESKWRSFRSGTSNPLTVRTLIKMAKETPGANIGVLNSIGDGFLPAEMEIVGRGMVDATVPHNQRSAEAAASLVSTTPKVEDQITKGLVPHFLERFSLRGQSAELSKRSMDEKPILGEIGLKGQLMVIFAAPNTGKTLITLHLLLDAINRGRINPDRLFYLNMDDNSKGLADKCRIADDYGFHMLAGGYKGFKAQQLEDLVTDMVEKGKVDGAVLVLDTMKKFVNVMDKKDCSRFAAAMRNFAMQGGTLIALAHVNKKPGADGQAIYAGTADIRDDFDNAYVLTQVSVADGAKTVEFKNIKRRGNNPETAGYSYSIERLRQYEDVLMSVKEIDPFDLEPIKKAAAIVADEVLITSIEGQIKAGVVKKMELIKSVSALSNASRADVDQIVVRYTGEDAEIHRWNYKTGARGAKLFKLLDRPAPRP